MVWLFSRSAESAGERSRQAERDAMVRTQIARRGIIDEGVLTAMRSVPRHEFLPQGQHAEAYEDHPVPLGCGQTMSQPYIVALMTEQARLRPSARVLEVGTGCGYQAAVLAEIAAKVYSLEIVAELADRARATCQRLAYRNVTIACGDGYAGWPEHAPFDAILVAAASPRIPPPLLSQLAYGGRLVAPVGTEVQVLTVWTRTETGLEREDVLPVRFVPMTGRVSGD